MAQQLPENLFNLMGLHLGGDLGPLTFYKSKRGKLVWFDKAPPTTPPSWRQTSQRSLFRAAAQCWRLCTPEQRQQYELAARKASLCMTGYNLFVHLKLKPDPNLQRTIESQTNTVLA